MRLHHNFYQAIAENAQNYPEKIALHSNEKNITYYQLHQNVMRLSKRLKAADIKKGDVVAVYMPNSIELLISIYAVLSLRAVVLPVDISIPQERVNIIFAHSRPALVLYNKDTPETAEYNSLKSMAVDLLSLEADGDAADCDLIDISEEDGAFCIYTSGTTGIPKGVFLKYKGILNHASAKADLLNLTQGSRLCLSFSIGFVASIWQIIVPVLMGAELFIYDGNLIKKPYQFFKQVEKDKIKVVSMTPHTLQSYLEYIKIKNRRLLLPDITHIILTGEKISGALAKEFYSNYKSITLVNAYGQTECSDDTYHYMIPGSFNQAHVPIGKPIDGIAGFVLKEDFTECGTGELFIGGLGVADGYISDRELTERKFVKLPFFSTPLFRTGDIVKRIDEAGNLAYLGRVDNQVKIRGYRVELEEIETYLNQFDGIKQAVAGTLEKDGDIILQAFYTSDTHLDQKEIRDYLAAKLPAYMVPAIFKRVQSFMLTGNRKIDRKRVSECIEIKTDLIRPDKNDSEALNGFQSRALEALKSVLDVNTFGELTLENVLEDIGMDSINFVASVSALESEFNFEWEDGMLVMTEFTTVKSMIDYAESRFGANHS